MSNKLIKPIKRSFGRDNLGRISIRHKGGGVYHHYREISILTGKGKVIALEYDPNRTAKIALIEKENKEKIYILAPDKLKTNDEIICAEKAALKPGNRMKLKNILPGTAIHSLDIHPGSGAKMVKAAGSIATLLAIDEEFAHVKLPSGETRKFYLDCFASIGQLSNPEHNLEKFYKAGQKRYRGIRPTVRGKVMHPAAHPHGGGEGVNPIGLKYPKSPWGKIAIGGKTRDEKKASDKFIIMRRKK